MVNSQFRKHSFKENAFTQSISDLCNIVNIPNFSTKFRVGIIGNQKKSAFFYSSCRNILFVAYKTKCCNEIAVFPEERLVNRCSIVE